MWQKAGKANPLLGAGPISRNNVKLQVGQLIQAWRGHHTGNTEKNKRAARAEVCRYLTECIRKRYQKGASVLRKDCWLLDTKTGKDWKMAHWTEMSVVGLLYYSPLWNHRKKYDSKDFPNSLEPW